MKEQKDRLFPNGFGEINDLNNNTMPKPKLKENKEITPIEKFNKKLGAIFKMNDDVSDAICIEMAYFMENRSAW